MDIIVITYHKLNEKHIGFIMKLKFYFEFIFKYLKNNHFILKLNF
jgi:hypothetical protein